MLRKHILPALGAFAVYLVTTNLKGVSSMKLHRDLGVSQKTAWHLAHRIREVWKTNNPTFSGPVEADAHPSGPLRPDPELYPHLGRQAP